jgi:hypothetical protein
MISPKRFELPAPADLREASLLVGICLCLSIDCNDDQFYRIKTTECEMLKSDHHAKKVRMPLYASGLPKWF